MLRSGTEAVLWEALEISSALSRESCQSQQFVPPDNQVVLCISCLVPPKGWLDLCNKHSDQTTEKTAVSLLRNL